MAGRRHGARAGVAAAIALTGALLAGCAISLAGEFGSGLASPADAERVEDPLAYYGQSAAGHLRLLAAAKPVQAWLDDPATPARLKTQLAQAQAIRAFASRELGLPDNASYTRYAALDRPAALWNLVAAPPLSLQLRTWCYPVTGCVSYQGWFDEGRAQAEAARLRGRGLDVTVYPVPAYSTLGWSNWLGGDPLLSTFIQGGESELARLIFHELAHQQLYVKGDTAFNESFATAVEHLGVARWLARTGSPAARQASEAGERRRQEFRALKRQAREALAQAYAEPGLSDAQRLARKAQVLQALREGWQQLRAQWLAQPGGDPARFAATDRWVAEANNASLGAEAAYDVWVPAFEALFARVATGEPARGLGPEPTPAGREDWLAFYAAVRRLAELAPPARRAALEDLLRTGS